MKPGLVLLVSGEAGDSELLRVALESTAVRVSVIADVAKAFAEADAQRPDLVLIGTKIPRDHAQWLLERIIADADLRETPVVLMFYESRRSWVLEMIKLGLRAYIQLPREKEDFLRRLAQHLPPGTLGRPTQADAQVSRDSVGERLRQRLAKRQIENATALTRGESPAEAGRRIMVLEQQFTDESGLTVRTSTREMSLFEKIDDYLLRFGGSNSHVIGIFMGLLVDGKIRVGFRHNSERLSLVDPSSKKTPEVAMQLIDAHLRQCEASNTPDSRTQKIVL